MCSRIYFDTAPLIYFLDRSDSFYHLMKDFIFRNYREDNQFYTSVLTDMEYLTFPYKTGDVQKIDNYHGFLRDLVFKKIDVTREICLGAARLRGRYDFLRQMDALHIASCIFYNCDFFLTNDKQLKQVEEISTVYLGDL